MFREIMRLTYIISFAVFCSLFVSVADAAEKGSGTPPSSAASVQQETGYWLSKSGKRHNSSCRYYRCKGRPCSKDEGVACKVCKG